MYTTLLRAPRSVSCQKKQILFQKSKLKSGRYKKYKLEKYQIEKYLLEKYPMEKHPNSNLNKTFDKIENFITKQTMFTKNIEKVYRFLKT